MNTPSVSGLVPLLATDGAEYRVCSAHAPVDIEATLFRRVTIAWEDPGQQGRSNCRCLDEHVLDSISPRDDTAALFVEAIQSEGGDLFPSAAFLQGLERVCRENGILLVLDEVKVGMGRSGDWFAYQNAGIRPDVVILGKALGGGLPLSAVLGPAHLLDVGTALALFTTAGGAVATAAGAAAVRQTEEDGLMENTRSVGASLKAELASAASRTSLIGDVRGRGLIIGVELVADSDRSPATAETAKVVWRCFELGLVVFYVGLRSDVLEITPPLSLTLEEAQAGARIIEQAVTDVANGWEPPEAFGRYAGW